ncbi:MAG: ExbD/TolR family protein [Longimicrobiales bacterium]
MALIRRRRPRTTGEIPTASMADIAFLLLIFFLVSTVFEEEKGLQLVLPESTEEQQVPQSDLLHIIVQPDGMVRLKLGQSSSEQLVQPDALPAIWRQQSNQNPSLIAAVETDPTAPYKYMVDVLDALQRAGASRISLQVLE